MNKKEIKSLLIETFEKATPDQFEKIKEDCINKKGYVFDFRENEKVRNRYWLRFAGLAAAILLVFTVSLLVISNTVKTSVFVDSQSSVSIDINPFNRILSIYGNNEKGKKIVEKNKINKNNLEDAISDILVSMKENDYLSEDNNTVLITIQNESVGKSSDLYTELSQMIKKDRTNIINYILQTIKWSDENTKKAKSYQTSPGYISFVSGIADDSTYSFNELMSVNVNDLMRIVENNNIYIKDATLFGKTNNQKLIGEQRAEKIALEDSRYDKKDIKNKSINLSINNKKLIYVVRMGNGIESSMYIIDAYTGEIIDKTSIKGNFVQKHSENKEDGNKTINKEKRVIDVPVENKNEEDISDNNKAKDKILTPVSPEETKPGESTEAEMKKKEYENFVFNMDTCRYRNLMIFDVAIPYSGESIPFFEKSYDNNFYQKGSIDKEELMGAALICNANQFKDFFNKSDNKYNDRFFNDSAIIALSYKLIDKEAKIIDIVKGGNKLYLAYTISELNSATINKKTLIYEIKKDDIYNVVDIAEQ